MKRFIFRFLMIGSIAALCGSSAVAQSQITQTHFGCHAEEIQVFHVENLDQGKVSTAIKPLGGIKGKAGGSALNSTPNRGIFVEQPGERVRNTFIPNSQMAITARASAQNALDRYIEYWSNLPENRHKLVMFVEVKDEEGPYFASDGSFDVWHYFDTAVVHWIELPN